MLTNEPSLVAGACELLAEVLAHNAEALAGLYRTGIFFFLLAYCGSNLGEAARLLKVGIGAQEAGRCKGPAAAGTDSMNTKQGLN